MTCSITLISSALARAVTATCQIAIVAIVADLELDAPAFVTLVLPLRLVIACR